MVGKAELRIWARLRATTHLGVMEPAAGQTQATPLLLARLARWGLGVVPLAAQPPPMAGCQGRATVVKEYSKVTKYSKVKEEYGKGERAANSQRFCCSAFCSLPESGRGLGALTRHVVFLHIGGCP